MELNPPRFEIFDGTPQDKDMLHFSSKGTKAGLCLYNFIDKDTKQFVAFCPALELSAYGETEEKCKEMLKFSLQDYLRYLGSMPIKERDKELFSLGWKRNRFKNKDFSKAYVDISGQLQNMNADEGSVKRTTLQTA